MPVKMTLEIGMKDRIERRIKELEQQRDQLAMHLTAYNAVLGELAALLAEPPQETKTAKSETD